jgi:hypothetical protein
LRVMFSLYRTKSGERGCTQIKTAALIQRKLNMRARSAIANLRRRSAARFSSIAYAEIAGWAADGRGYTRIRPKLWVRSVFICVNPRPNLPTSTRLPLGRWNRRPGREFFHGCFSFPLGFGDCRPVT